MIAIKVFDTESGVRLRCSRVTLTTTAGQANSVAHGLPAAPLIWSYIPANGTGTWFETSFPDATNAYLTCAGNGPTSFTMVAFY